MPFLLGACSLDGSASSELGATISASSSSASSSRSLTTTWRELRLGGELLARRPEAALDLLGVVGAAPDQARAQRLERRRRDEDLHRLGHRLAHLARALDLDLEHDRDARRHAALELRAQRPVAVAGVVGVLDELARATRRSNSSRLRKW